VNSTEPTAADGAASRSELFAAAPATGNAQGRETDRAATSGAGEILLACAGLPSRLPNAGAPSVLPRFEVLRESPQEHLPAGEDGQPRPQVEIDDDASLQRAIDDSRLPGIGLPRLYVVDTERRLANLLADGDIRADALGHVPNVFLRTRMFDTATASERDGYAMVRLARNRAADTGPLTQLRADPHAPTPYRVAGGTGWQPQATTEEADRYFAEVFNEAGSRGDRQVPSRALSSDERAQLEGQPQFAPRQAPASIAVGPHVDFTRVYASREEAHAVFGPLIGPIAGEHLAPGAGPLANRPAVEYASVVIPRRMDDGSEGHQLLPPVVSAHNGRAFVPNALQQQTLTSIETLALQSLGRVPGVTHTHPFDAPAGAGLHEALVFQDRLSDGDIVNFCAKAGRDPEYALSVYLPATKATQLLKLGDSATQDWSRVSASLDWYARHGGSGVFADHADWFELHGLRIDADGSLRATDWLQTLQESEATEVRAVAAEFVRMKAGAPHTLEDLFVDELVNEAAARLDAQPP
jgi:hypothetical protein